MCLRSGFEDFMTHKKKAKKAFQNGGSIVGGTRRAENKRMLRERWTLIGCQRCNTGNKLESV